MPELPDVTVYVECLRSRAGGATLRRSRLLSPFVLRSVDPPIVAAVGRTLVGVERLGKRIVLELDGELFIIIHLMIAGRLRWLNSHAKPPGRITLATFEFDTGTLVLTETGSKKRASIHVAQGRAALAEHDPGGADIFAIDAETFAAILRRENHTLKRALTDPRLFSGIGNAFSDEILRDAGLSPVALTQRLSDSDTERLFEAARSTLSRWTDLLRKRFATRFPGLGDITASRPEFAVHGKFGKPCIACGATVQRIRYASRETNYCPGCQTGGRILADRSLSRLLKDDWPRRIDD